MTPQAVPCPRCALVTAVHVPNGRLQCSNCRWQWDADAPEGAARAAAPGTEELLRDFSMPERARLLAYRAAVRAGFYNDGTAEEGSGRPDWGDLQPLFRAPARGDAAAPG